VLRERKKGSEEVKLFVEKSRGRVRSKQMRLVVINGVIEVCGVDKEIVIDKMWRV